MFFKEDKQKMQAGNYTKMKDCAVLNYLLYIVFPTPPFLHHITASVIITHEWDMGMFVLSTR